MTILDMDDNAAWQQRSLHAVWHPCTQMQRARHVPPLPISRGYGPWLEDYDGQRYFDVISSWWVNLFGHADPHINAVIVDQLGRLPHVMLAGCTHMPAVELAERLSALTGQVLGHVFYASDGASAVEIALKMSFHYWRNCGKTAKREFVCLRQGYHGETLGALAVTDVAVFRDAYDPLLMRSHLVMSPDARQAGPDESSEDVVQRAVEALRALLEAHHASIAALIVEPLVQCAAGMAMYDAAYLRAVRMLCDEYQVHLIADEIAVGCGRTGRFFAFEHTAQEGRGSVWPDFLCLSKGITGGYLPLSLVMTRDHVYEAFLDDDLARGFLHSHSYTGNALACRAALAVLDRFEQEDVLNKNRQWADVLSAALSSLQSDERVRHVRNIGMIWAFDVLEAYAGERFAERFYLTGRAHGLLIRPIGRTVYLMPPYMLDRSLAGWLAEHTLATLDITLTTSSQSLLSHADYTSDPSVA